MAAVNSFSAVHLDSRRFRRNMLGLNALFAVKRWELINHEARQYVKAPVKGARSDLEPSMTSRLVAAVAVLLMPYVCSGADGHYTIEDNFRYRLSWGDLGDLKQFIAAPGESRRALRLAEGGEQLLDLCRKDPEHWQKDPLLFRFGHSHPTSTIGCRERSSPSLHAVFYRQPDDSREAWVHFDLHGPQAALPHLSEVIRNRMTFGRTDESEVHRSLVRAAHDAGEPVPPPRYNAAEHARQYLHDAFGPSAVAIAIGSAAATSAFQNAAGWQLQNSRFLDRVSANIVRNALAQSIQFGASAFLQQEQKFQPSHERGFRRRAGQALYRSFFVPGRDGEELAFPRIAAALGTPWAMRPLYAAQRRSPDPWVETGQLFGRYVVRSFWAEFHPEISRTARKMFHRP